MRDARLVGLSEDGRSLVLAVNAVDGPEERLQLPIDDRLRRALPQSPARSGGSSTGRSGTSSSGGPQLEIEMTSALRPRDIQTRIRAGQTAEQVAQAAQLPVERIMAFAAPVLAERAHIAETAQRGTVRRTGEGPVRSLAEWIDERFAERGVDADSADWDAWRDDRGRWLVRLDYRSGDRPHRATFTYDTQGRVVVAADDEARWLVGEASTRRGPQPRGRRLSAVPQPGDARDAGDAEDTDEVVRAGSSTRRRPGEPDLFSSLGAEEAAVRDRDADGDAAAADAIDELDEIDDDVAGEQVVDGEVPDEVASSGSATGSDDESDSESDAESDDDEQRRRFGRRSAPRPKRPSVPSWDEIMFGRKSD